MWQKKKTHLILLLQLNDKSLISCNGWNFYLQPTIKERIRELFQQNPNGVIFKPIYSKCWITCHLKPTERIWKMSDGFDEGVLCVFPIKAVEEWGVEGIDCWASAIHDMLLNHKFTTMLTVLMKICCMSVHIKQPCCVLTKNFFFVLQPAFIPHTNSSFLHLIVKAKCSGHVLTVINEGGVFQSHRLCQVESCDPAVLSWLLSKKLASQELVGTRSSRVTPTAREIALAGAGGKVSWAFKTHLSNVVFSVKSLCILTRCLSFKHGSLTQNRNF